MKVEQWLRGHFHGLGSQIELNVLEVAAISPMEALPLPMNPVHLDDEIEERYQRADDHHHKEVSERVLQKLYVIGAQLYHSIIFLFSA